MKSGFVSPTPRYFFQHVMEPTRQRVTDNPGTLDVIFTNGRKQKRGKLMVIFKNKHQEIEQPYVPRKIVHVNRKVKRMLRNITQEQTVD